MHNLPQIGQKHKYVDLDPNQLSLQHAPKKTLYHYFSVLGKSFIPSSDILI